MEIEFHTRAIMYAEIRVVVAAMRQKPVEEIRIRQPRRIPVSAESACNSVARRSCILVCTWVGSYLRAAARLLSAGLSPL